MKINRFPSPCGVLVLKVAHMEGSCEAVTRVSVPLRGSGS